MRYIKLLLMAGLLAGCATAYQPSGVLSYGFSELQLSDNVWRVTFEGNSSTSMREAYDLATLRAADLAVSHGYSYFMISDVQTENRVSTQTMPGASKATMATPVTGGAPVQVITRGQGMTFTSNYPTSILTATMYRSRPETEAAVYDARFVCQKLGAENDVACGNAK